MQSRVEKKDLGISPPLWNLYTWNLETIRSEKYIDYNSDDDGGGIPLLSQVSLPIGPGSVFIDLDEINQFLGQHGECGQCHRRRAVHGSGRVGLPG